MQSNTSKPLFTIITSTLNAMETIGRCVESVAAQTFRDYEHIVVDGASTDGTAEFLNSRKDQFSVLISEPDTGIYNAWNKALKHARGEWVLFLGADDILADKDVLGDVAGFIEEQGAASGIVYGDVMLVTKGRYEERELKRVLPEEICTKDHGSVRPLLPCQSGIFHHKLLLGKYGPFDESYRICADAKLLLSALFGNNEHKNRIPKTVYKMTVGGVCSTIGVKAAQENLRILRELNIPFSFVQSRISILKAHAKFRLLKLLGEKHAYRIVDLVRALQGKPSLWQ